MSLPRFAFILLTVGAIIATAVVIGGAQLPAALILVSMIRTTLQVATPLTLGALSGVYCERAGVVNIAIEGMMLLSAFFGFVASIYTNQAIAGTEITPTSTALSLIVGVTVAILIGGLSGAFHAALSVTFRVNQIISGTVINILAIGLTGYLNRQLFFQGQVPHAPGVLPTIHIPVLADLPVFGKIFEQQLIAITAIALVVVTHFVLFHTPWGLRTRAVGEHPRAADTVGINVFKMRYANTIIGGMIAGLAGAYFTLESVPSFEPLMTNGRGFISLAAMIFGGWTPFGAWAASLVFGAAQALQINAQGFGIPVPSQFVGMLPYILTMIALTGIVGKTSAPAADGIAYEKTGG